MLKGYSRGKNTFKKIHIYPKGMNAKVSKNFV